jgi:hypothetical protein
MLKLPSRRESRESAMSSPHITTACEVSEIGSFDAESIKVGKDGDRSNSSRMQSQLTWISLPARCADGMEE